MYDIVADMQYASLQGKSPRTFTARNVLPRRRGSLWRPRMGWRESMKLETKTLLKTSVTSWYVVMFFKGLFFFGIDCWHWFMCWMKKIFQSLPIVDWYGCDTLNWWNSKFPSGRMMRSQCHRKAIPDTRCWLRGLTAGCKDFFLTQIQFPNAKTHLLLQEIEKGLLFLRWKGPDKAFPW